MSNLDRPDRPFTLYAHSSRSRLYGLLISVFLFLPVGCRQNLSDSFGAVDAQARTSINGLGVHKRLWQQAGSQCITPTSLSRRLETVDVIVLVPTSFDPPSLQAMKWLEEWLAASPGRTVIYFGRDFNAKVHYLESVLSGAEFHEQPRLRFELAMAKSSELQARLASYTENTFCGWFSLDVTKPNRSITELEGPWAESLQRSATGDVMPIQPWPVQTRLVPPKLTDQSLLQPKSLSQQSSKAPSAAANTANQSGSSNQESDQKFFRSVWTAEQWQTNKDWDDQFSNMLTSQMLLQSKQGDPLVFRLTHPERLVDGQILVVANGAPFLNGTLIHASFLDIANKIVQACPNKKRVALFPYDETGIQISTLDELDSRGLGLEMLITWPLSVITIPACLLGIVVCISLLPILGRPAELKREKVSDFGMHVQAFGQLLQDTRDAAYAKESISEYFRTVRGEQPPSWLNKQE